MFDQRLPQTHKLFQNTNLNASLIMVILAIGITCECLSLYDVSCRSCVKTQNIISNRILFQNTNLTLPRERNSRQLENGLYTTCLQDNVLTSCVWLILPVLQGNYSQILISSMQDYFLVWIRCKDHSAFERLLCVSLTTSNYYLSQRHLHKYSQNHM